MAAIYIPHQASAFEPSISCGSAPHTMSPDFFPTYYSPFKSNMTPTFTYFNRLPAELRLKCWQEALPTEPRTIHLKKVTSSTPRSSPRGRRYHSYTFYCMATTLCPSDLLSLLQCCQESRTEVLRRFKPLLAPKVPKNPLVPLNYFDSSIDGIFVDSIWPWHRVVSKPTGVYEARQLSIHCNAWWLAWTRESRRKELLGEGGLLSFRNLEKLTIVFRVITDDERGRLGVPGYYPFLKPSTRPRGMSWELEFPAPDVNIEIAPIMEEFGKMEKRSPGWKVPEVKLMLWGARPS